MTFRRRSVIRQLNLEPDRPSRQRPQRRWRRDLHPWSSSTLPHQSPREQKPSVSRLSARLADWPTTFILAEQRIFKGQLTPDSPPILLKHRFKKKYRHEALDTSLTKARVAGEARILLKCLKFVRLDLFKDIVTHECPAGRAFMFLRSSWSMHRRAF